jgi:hypothetical protein
MEWQCPCPACNGLMVDPEPEVDYEPEHPENMAPRPASSYWFYAVVDADLWNPV